MMPDGIVYCTLASFSFMSYNSWAVVNALPNLVTYKRLNAMLRCCEPSGYPAFFAHIVHCWFPLSCGIASCSLVKAQHRQVAAMLQLGDIKAAGEAARQFQARSKDMNLIAEVFLALYPPCHSFWLSAGNPAAKGIYYCVSYNFLHHHLLSQQVLASWNTFVIIVYNALPEATFCWIYICYFFCNS